MASDRGTIPRTTPGGADQQAPWNEPTLPAGRRMPSAPRERKPLLVVLALLLIVVGAGAAGLVVQRMNSKISAIEVVTTVQQDSQLTAADLGEVQVAQSSGVNYVPWSDAASVIKFFAAEKIPQGTLLTEQMVSPTNTLASGRDTVGLALKDGQLPDGLQVGQTVNVYSTSSQAGGCPGQPGHVLATGATVLSIGAGRNGSGMTDVEIALNDLNAGDVACNTANGTAAIAVVPAGNG